MLLYVFIYICNQNYCLAKQFKTPADQRTPSAVHSLSPSTGILCAGRCGWEAGPTLFVALPPRAREEQECFVASGKHAPSIRDLYLRQLIFLATASLLIFVI